MAFVIHILARMLLPWQLLMVDTLRHHLELRSRTKEFSYRIIRLFQSLPHNAAAYVIGKQLLRCGTSVAANYRAVGRARSRADACSKLAIVLEEADESVYWLECLADHNIVRADLLSELIAEANALVKIFSASLNTARQNKHP